MFNKIRSMLADDGKPFSGTVEADEAYMGGRGYWKHGTDHKVGRPRGGRNKTAVFGLAQRGSGGKSGKVKAVIVDSASKRALLPHVQAKVLLQSIIYTDEWHSYDSLGKVTSVNVVYENTASSLDLQLAATSSFTSSASTSLSMTSSLAF